MQTYAAPRDPTAVMGRRVGAWIVDIVLIGLIFLIGFIAFAQTIDNLGFDPCGAIDSSLCVYAGDTAYVVENGDAGIIYLLMGIYSFLVWGVLQGTTGATPGKALFGLRTIRRDTGQIAGVGKSLVRWLLLIIDWFVCFLIGLISALATDGHKRIGDMAAGTAVVDKKDVGTPLDAAPGYDPGQQWAAPVGGYAPPPPGAPPPGGYAPPPGGYAPPPPSGYAPPPPGDFAAPAAGAFGAAAASEPDFMAPPPGDFAAPATPPPDDFIAPATPPPDDFIAPATPPPDDFAAPTTPPPDDFIAPAPTQPAEPPVAEAPVAPAPPVPIEEPPVVQSNQPPATSEPQWDAARNTYIQWDPVLAAWMQWDEPMQRWKHIDT